MPTLLQVETKYEEEREKVQQQLLREQNEILNKYKDREVRYYFELNYYLNHWKFSMYQVYV